MPPFQQLPFKRRAPLAGFFPEPFFSCLTLLHTQPNPSPYWERRWQSWGLRKERKNGREQNFLWHSPNFTWETFNSFVFRVQNSGLPFHNHFTRYFYLQQQVTRRWQTQPSFAHAGSAGWCKADGSGGGKGRKCATTTVARLKEHLLYAAGRRKNKKRRDFCFCQVQFITRIWNHGKVSLSFVWAAPLLLNRWLLGALSPKTRQGSVSSFKDMLKQLKSSI